MQLVLFAINSNPILSSGLLLRKIRKNHLMRMVFESIIASVSDIRNNQGSFQLSPKQTRCQLDALLLLLCLILPRIFYCEVAVCTGRYDYDMKLLDLGQLVIGDCCLGG
jgi:hypothetical protein